jgi:hypothetical protein
LTLLAAPVIGILVTSAHRAVLKTRWPWLGGVIALVIWLPNLVWQFASGWPQLAMASALHQQNTSTAGGDAALVDGGTAVVGGDVVAGVVVGGSVVVGAAVVGGVVVVGAEVVVVAVTVATFVLEVSSPIAAPMPPRTTVAATAQAMTCFQRARFRKLRQGFMRLPPLSAL